MSYQDIITIELGKRGGKPCIRGMRITVYDVLDYVQEGWRYDQIAGVFRLPPEDIQAALQYIEDHRAEVMADYLRAMRANPDQPDFSYRFARALWINNFLGPTANGRDALRFERLGLSELADREFERCAERETSASLCVDHALAAATDPAEIARLETLRRRFEPERAVEASFGPLRLAGTSTVPEQVPRGSSLPLDLFWRCDRSVPRRYAVFVHFRGPGRFQSDHEPAGGEIPTPTWVPGETVRDSFAVTIPGEAPPGLYTAEVGLWDPSRRVRLRRGWFGKSAVDAFQIRVSE